MVRSVVVSALARIGGLAALAAGLAPLGCGEDPPPPPPPPPTELRFAVTGASGMPVPGAEITLLPDGEPQTTDASGVLLVEVEPGQHPFRAQAAGHLSLPEPEPLAAEPVAVAVKEQTTDVPVRLDPRPGAAAGGTITGRVTIAGQPAAGVVVVATGTVEAGTVTDARGNYRILGAPAGLYGVRAWLGGHRSSERSNVQVDTGGEISAIDLELTPDAGARVGGVLEGGSTGVWLTLASTGDVVPGLSASFDGSWSFEGVPPGRYHVRAYLEDDARTLDPDLIRTRQEPIIQVTGTASVTVRLPAAPVIPEVTTSTAGGTVAFSWSAVPDADFYVVEVSNVLGQVIWGGFDAMRRPAFRVLDGTQAAFGAVAQPVEPLRSGHAYRVRIYAGVDTISGTLFELIAASEELDGRFIAP